MALSPINVRTDLLALEDAKADQARRDREKLLRDAQLIPSPLGLQRIRDQIRNSNK